MLTSKFDSQLDARAQLYRPTTHVSMSRGSLASSDKASPPLIGWPRAAKTVDSVPPSPGVVGHTRRSTISFTLCLQKEKGWPAEARRRGAKGKVRRQRKGSVRHRRWPGGGGNNFPQTAKRIQSTRTPYPCVNLLKKRNDFSYVVHGCLYVDTQVTTNASRPPPPCPLSLSPQVSPVAVEPHPGLVHDAF